jgi:hypothetical protein
MALSTTAIISSRASSPASLLPLALCFQPQCSYWPYSHTMYFDSSRSESVSRCALAISMFPICLLHLDVDFNTTSVKKPPPHAKANASAHSSSSHSTGGPSSLSRPVIQVVHTGHISYPSAQASSFLHSLSDVRKRRCR